MDDEHIDYNEFLNTDELLVKIDSEIYKLERELKKDKIENKKLKFLRELKSSFLTMRLALPYVVTGALTFSMFSFFGHTPFKVDEVKQGINSKTLRDSLGNVNYEEQYDDFESNKPTITYYGDWRVNANGLYVRDVRVYNISSISQEVIDRMLSNDIKSLDEAFGKPIKKYSEKKESLTREEVDEPPYLVSCMYSHDENRYIMKKESIYNNVSDTITWAAVTILVEMLPLWYRTYYSGFNYEYSVDFALKQYEDIDLEDIKRRLDKLKKDKQRLRQ